MSQQTSLTLARVLQRLALWRIFLPLVVLSVITIGAVGYFGEQTLESQQHQRAQILSRMVDRYLDHAARTLESVARVAEVTPSAGLAFMQGTWEAYGYFDTLYYLDGNSKIELLVPPDQRYVGLDMSNLPHFKQTGEKKELIISRPFISLRTGNPTVYLVRQLSEGGRMVGELNLGSLQDEIIRRKPAPGEGVVFIMDQLGMLLAHPSFTLVKQQTNHGNLEIFRRGISGDATLIYEYAGTMVLGSATRVERTGWVVVDQVPLSTAFMPYAWALGLTLMASLAIWLALTWNLRGQLQKHVVIPLVQLSRGIGALANGDFTRGKALASIPGTFAELTTLSTDFQHMSDALESRQTALQESEERYRGLFENVPVALYRTTPAGHFLDINLAYVRMLGFPDREDLLKVNAADLYPHPEERERWRAIAEREGIARDFSIQLRRHDGTVIWARNTGRAVRDSHGNVVHYEGSLEDITERKMAEDSIRKLSQAIEQSPVSIIITDAAGRIEFVNTKFTQVTGYADIEVIGRNPGILKSGETPPEEYSRLWRTIGSGGVWRGEFHNRKKNGELFWEYATISPVRDADNAITHYVAVKEDITDRKKLAEQLRQTQKMEAVGQLAGGVAHDFNNMLGVIIGYAELTLDRSDLDDSLRDNIQAILSAGHRSSEITRQLLAFARKQTISPRVLDLNETIEGMLKLLRRLIGEDIELVWLPGEKLWPVKMDPSQIDQILANLCVNARDAIIGVGKVTIETHKTEFDDIYCANHKGFLPGAYVMLAVSDNGGGMDKPTMDKIFEPFFTTKGMGKGTGLGLATVYGIIKQNSGFINVYSEPEHGSTFKIYLPRHSDMTGQEPKAIPALQALGGHETILVVEDEIEPLRVVKLMLEKYGYPVLAASSPSEALIAAKNHTGRIHLLLTDLIMPEMNGRELSKKMTSLYPDMACLLMSGYTGNVIAHHGVLEEGFHFLQKPFSMQDLLVKVREVLDAG
jgi:two-component system, cell cycle sensor histidine kinase and response regulator CckA